MLPKIRAVRFNSFPDVIGCISKEKSLYPKEVRLRFYLETLESCDSACDADEALYLVQNCLTHIENLYSGEPERVEPPMDVKGRMYPAREDYIERKNDGRIIVTTRGNLIEIAPNGGFVIKNRRDIDEVWLSKDGK
jgi:hypothetical protein